MSISVLPFRRMRLYFLMGLLGVALLAYLLHTGQTARAAAPKHLAFAFSVVTGTALAVCVAYQCALLFARLAGYHRSARLHYRNHRYVGTAALYLFILHAGGIGYALLTILPLLFLAVSVTGLFNSEIIVMRPGLRRAWGYMHVGLSGLLLPLIALHAWAALAFK
jgi:hypothetical protein